ncbi:MAG: hypothetical protein WAU89_14050 [Candidatus Acidiferrales bacterium]
MNPRTILGAISFCLALSGMVTANLFVTMMIGEINRKRQDGNLVSYFGFTFPKMQRIFREYRSSYPDGKLHFYALTAFAVAAICLVIVAVCLRIIG